MLALYDSLFLVHKLCDHHYMQDTVITKFGIWFLIIHLLFKKKMICELVNWKGKYIVHCPCIILSSYLLISYSLVQDTWLNRWTEAKLIPAKTHTLFGKSLLKFLLRVNVLPKLDCSYAVLICGHELTYDQIVLR